MPWPKRAYNNYQDTLSKEDLEKIIYLRTVEKLPYDKIGKVMKKSGCTIFKIVKKHLGLGTHRSF